MDSQDFHVFQQLSYNFNGFQNQAGQVKNNSHGISGESTYIIPTNLRDLMLKDSIFQFE